jgi:L-cysteine desulfidase
MSFTVKDILRMEVAPALGCTEPSAVALGAAAAVSLIGDNKITDIEVWVDANIYKNGLAVSIPGTEGLYGLDNASALGATGGDPELKLEVLDSVDHEAIAGAKRLVQEGRVKINLLKDQEGLFVRTLVKSGHAHAESVIKGFHDNIVSLALNGKQISNSPLISEQGSESNAGRLHDLEEWIRGLSLAELLELIDDLDTEDLEFLKDGVRFNE